MKITLSRALLATSSFLFVYPSFANTAADYSFTAFSQMPRVSLWGLTNDTDRAGNADVFIPTLSNVDSLLYTDLQGRWGSGGQGSGWFAGIGSGYRYVLNSNQILGGYVFLDRNQAPHDSIFWVASPGVEAIGPVWEERVNGYIPIGSQENKLSTAFGSQIGIYNGVNFTGHDAYDHIYNTVEEVGAGADAEVGRVIPQLNNLHAYLGGYYFSMPESSNVRGVEGRLEYPATRNVNVLAEDTFDNLNHNTFMVGVKWNFGVPLKTSNDIRDHLLDQVDRHVGMLDMATGVPTKKITYETNHNVLQNDNVWFFSPGGGLTNTGAGSPPQPTIDAQDCTYEHPCSGGQFTQANVNEINSIAPNAALYFAPGSYTPGGIVIASPPIGITLNSGQSIYGRSSDFTTPGYVAGTTMTINGALTLDGDNTIDSLTLLNKNGGSLAGITAVDASNITISHSTIGALNSTQGYVDGIVLDNAQNVDITNSTINAYGNTAVAQSGYSVLGINAINGSSFNLSQDVVNAESVVNNNSTAVVGISLDNSTGNASNVDVNILGNLSGDNSTVSEVGLYVDNHSVLTFSGNVNSALEATGNDDGLVYATLIASSHSTLNFMGNVNTSAVATGDANSIDYATVDAAGDAAVINMSGNITNNSTINGSDGRLLAFTFFTEPNFGTTINYTGGRINNTATIVGDDGSVIDEQVFAATNSTVNVSNATISDQVTANGVNSTIIAAIADVEGSLNYSNNTATLLANADGDVEISTFVAGADNATANISHSTFNVEGTSNSGDSTVYGINCPASNTGVVFSVSNNSFNLTADAAATGSVIAIQADSGSSVTATDNVFNMIARSAGSPGTYVDTTGTGTIINTNNTFNHN